MGNLSPTNSSPFLCFGCLLARLRLHPVPAPEKEEEEDGGLWWWWEEEEASADVLLVLCWWCDGDRGAACYNIKNENYHNLTNN